MEPQSLLLNLKVQKFFLAWAKCSIYEDIKVLKQ
jgi:hypothetical protein